MKKTVLAVACSFGLVSFSAMAGGNCLYGHGEGYAQLDDTTVEDQLAKEKVDPALLALLKKQEANQALVKPIATYN